MEEKQIEGLPGSRAKFIEVKFRFECGALFRSHVVSRLKEGAFMYGVELELHEGRRGWLDSDYYGAIRGDESKVLAFQKEWNEFFRKMRE